LKNLIYLFLLLSVSASADEPVNCNEIEDPTERLTCFDRAFPRPTQDPAYKDPASSGAVANKVEEPVEPADSTGTSKAVNSQPAQVQITNGTANSKPVKPEQSSDNNNGLFNSGLFNSPAVNFSSTIVAIQQGDKQKMVFRLENDEIWMQSSPRPLPFREGDSVTIENATAGGYFMRTPKGTSTRVKRIR